VSASSNAGSALGVINYQYDSGATVALPINNGSAQFTIALPQAGSHTISIAHPQQGNYAAATAPQQNFTVTLAPVNVALTPSTWYTHTGTSISFLASVASWSAGSPKATGAVSFSDGTTPLATVPVDGSGSASFATAGLSVGTHTVTAVYANGANYAAGSQSVNITIAP
jgi:hypothetical protein